MIPVYFTLFGFSLTIVIAFRGELQHRSLGNGLEGFRHLRPSMSGRFMLLILCMVSATMAGFILSGGWQGDGALTKNLVATFMAVGSAVWAHDVHEQLYARLIAWSPEAIILRDAGGEVRVDLADLVSVHSPAFSTRAILHFTGDRELEFERYLGNSKELLGAAG